MAKRRTLTQRVADLEGGGIDLEARLAAMEHGLGARFEEMQKWLANGFTNRVSALIAAKITELQTQILGDQLAAQKEENRKYGRERDAERDRKTRVTIAIIGSLGAIIGALAALLAVLL